jgi:hypothetical protein
LTDSRGVNGFSASKSGSDAETTAFFDLEGVLGHSRTRNPADERSKLVPSAVSAGFRSQRRAVPIPVPRRGYPVAIE